ncbi:MAG: polyketide synthase [Candidatus Acidoferrum typicum]|nr:polyketide synthase [Candidatus Acidoferrum typicum]
MNRKPPFAAEVHSSVSTDAVAAKSMPDSRECLREPVAIIGMACRFPGADSRQDLWNLLRNGLPAIGEMPPNRFDIDSYVDPTPNVPGKIVSRRGGFLRDVDRFDTYFFGIAPREAERIDPQQRLLLELGWEVFEDAGLLPERLAASRTGVFVGMWTNEYEDCMFNASYDCDLYTTTGGGRYAASGRLSYAFDLRGPSMTVDTACSSSLVAVHLACQSLRLGESTMALAGGVNLIFQPHISIGYSRGRMLSPDGQCKFGDASADGYVRSEGAGLVLLKSLSRALADGDRIHALILGSSVNNDGGASGLLVAPSADAQEEMLTRAYEDAGVAPGQVHYVEAHGTGTRVGDPVELKALAAVLGRDRPKDRPAQLGSIKANIGHTEAASGIAGLIKAVLVLQNRLVPGNPHFREPNPNIPWSTLPMLMKRELAPLWVTSGPAIAGVNSFGITGTNAHIVLQEAPVREARNETPEADIPMAKREARPPFLLPVSARSAEALRALALSYDRWLGQEGLPDLYDIACNAALRRTHHEYRLSLSVHSVEDLRECLHAFLAGEIRAGVTQSIKPAKPDKLVFVFPGQGSQWLGMGQVLLEREPVFRNALRECEQALRRYVDWSLLEQLAAAEPESRSDEIDIVQPMLFSIQVALAALWSSWGIRPDAVVGQSMGEIAAAYVAGALNLDDAARVICRRSQIMRRVSGKGSMALVDLSFEQASEAIRGLEDQVSIALSNSARSTVLAGDPATLESLIDRFERKSIFCRRIKVDVASHSPQMDPLRSDLLQAIEGIAPQASTIPTYSTVTGQRMEGSGFDAQYWADNLRKPGLFSTAIKALQSDGSSVFVEISPHPILLPSIREDFQLSGHEAITLPSMRRGENDFTVMLESLGSLHAHGYVVNWGSLYPIPGPHVDLPKYPWQRERFWYESSTAGVARRKLHTETPKAAEEERSNVEAAEGASQPKIEDLLYRITWQPQLLKTSQQSHLSADTGARGRWILFADTRGVAHSLAAKLTGSGDECLFLFPGEMSRDSDDGSFSLAPDDEQGFHDFFGRVLSRTSPTCKGIVYAWGLGSCPPVELTADKLDVASTTGCETLLHLIQCLSRAEAKSAPRLWLVTAGAHRIVDEDRSEGIAQSPLWGMGRVISNEHPELRCVRIDLSAAINKDEIHSLTDEIFGESNEEEVAFRRGTRYVARLNSWAVPGPAQALRSASTAPSSIRPTNSEQPSNWSKGSYLITGGFGGLGLGVAKWLVARGAKHLALVGRRGTLESAQAALADLRRAGAEVLEIKADISQPDQVEHLFAQTEEAMPALRGIFHAAGVLQDSLLLQLTPERLRAVMAPKVRGAWNLHLTSLGKPLDFFVLFSSVVGLLGSPGQANYAAANSFLDALASYRKSIGLPGLSIDWGPWSEVGMVAAKANGSDPVAFRGLASACPEDYLAAFALLLNRPEGQVAVMRFQLAHWQEFNPKAATSNFFAELRTVSSDAPAKSGPAGKEPSKSLRDLLATETSSRRNSIIEEHVKEHLSKIVRIPPNRIEANKPFKYLGLDSLMGLELRNSLQTSLDVSLPATIVFNYPTTALLSRYLADKIAPPEDESELTQVSEFVPAEFPGTLETNDRVDEILAEIESLSEQEVHRRMSSEIT